jgi:hypothetical protein
LLQGQSLAWLLAIGIVLNTSTNQNIEPNAYMATTQYQHKNSLAITIKNQKLIIHA